MCFSGVFLAGWNYIQTDEQAKLGWLYGMVVFLTLTAFINPAGNTLLSNKVSKVKKELNSRERQLFAKMMHSYGTALNHYLPEEQATIRQLFDEHFELSLFLCQSGNVSLEDVIILLDIVDKLKDYHGRDIRQLNDIQKACICSLQSVYRLIERGLLGKDSLLKLPTQHLQILDQLEQSIIDRLFSPGDTPVHRENRKCLNRVVKYLARVENNLSSEQFAAVLFAFRYQLVSEHCLTYANSVTQWLAQNLPLQVIENNLQIVSQLQIEDTIAVELPIELLHYLRPGTNCRYLWEQGALQRNDISRLTMSDFDKINRLRPEIIIEYSSRRTRINALRDYINEHLVEAINASASNLQAIQQLVEDITSNYNLEHQPVNNRIRPR